MSPVKVAPFEHSSLESIPTTAKILRTTFRSQKTKPLEYRLKQLRKLYWAIRDNGDALVEAEKIDLGKPSFEAHLTEVEWMKNEIIYISNNLNKWAKDQPAQDVQLANTLVSPKIRSEPLGTVLIIGAFNFPVQLTLGPLVGAIAAGCTAALKPSEAAPKTAMVLKKIIEESLDPDAYSVINGAIPETTALLDERWDKIFYTGNATVAKIIAKKAAETLTPITLELGGKNPAIVSKNSDPTLAARRLAWGKTVNAGQVCISQNYIMVENEILDAFIEQLRFAFKEFFPQGPKASPDYGRIVNNKQFLRIKKMLDDSKGKIIIGGELDEAENYIAPTVVLVDSQDDSLLADESFGPLIPILPVNSLDEAINIANSIHATPLAFYPFGTKEETDNLLKNITSGGATVNDAIFHGLIPNIPFGGVGDSGVGSYRGKYSFDAFSHRRTLASTPGWIEKLLNARYPPYSDANLAKLISSSEQKLNFDRKGNEVRGLGHWLGIVTSLGGEGAKGVLLRWTVLAFFAYGTRGVWAAKLPSRLSSFLK